MKKEVSLMEYIDTLNENKIDQLYIRALKDLGLKANLKDDLRIKKETVCDKTILIFAVALLTFTNKDEEDFKNIINGKKVSNINRIWLDNLFVVKDKNGKYVVPIEIKEVFDNASMQSVVSKKENMAVSFYLEVNGAIHIDKLLELLKKTGIKLTKNKLLECIKELNYILEDDVVYMHETVKSIGIYELKKDEYKVFSFEEMCLIMISNPQEEYEVKLRKLLKKHVKNVDQIVNAIIKMTMISYNYKEQIGSFLESENIKLNNKIKIELESLIEEIYFNIPSWELNGYFPFELMEEDENVETICLETEYIQAYLLINGVMRTEKMLDLLNNEHGFDLSMKKLKSIVKSLDNFKIMDDCIMFDSLMKEMKDEILMQKDLILNYKVIDDVRRIFQEYEENEFKAIEVGERYNLDSDTIAALYSFMILGGLEEDFVSHILEENNIKLEKSKFTKMTKELNNIAKNTRIWLLNGYKKRELQVTKTAKIGRNDKCLCGSGKKYKQCCGK